MGHDIDKHMVVKRAEEWMQHYEHHRDYFNDSMGLEKKLLFLEDHLHAAIRLIRDLAWAYYSDESDTTLKIPAASYHGRVEGGH